MRQCPLCQEELETDANFCPVCGVDFEQLKVKKRSLSIEPQQLSNDLDEMLALQEQGVCSKELYIKLATFFLNQERLNEANEQISAFLQESGNDVEALMLKARIIKKTDDKEQLKEVYATVAEQGYFDQEETFIAIRELIDIYQSENDLDNLIKYLELLIYTALHDDPLVRKKVGTDFSFIDKHEHLLHEMPGYMENYSILRGLIGLINQDLNELYRMLGMSYFKQEKFFQAANAFYGIADIDPSHAYFALTLIKIKKYSRAAELFDQIEPDTIAFNQEEEAILQEAFIAFLKQKKTSFQRRCEIAQKALAILPEREEIKQAISALYKRQGLKLLSNQEETRGLEALEEANKYFQDQQIEETLQKVYSNRSRREKIIAIKRYSLSILSMLFFSLVMLVIFLAIFGDIGQIWQEVNTLLKESFAGGNSAEIRHTPINIQFWRMPG